jgi:NhaP-type Na+/H+ or K+/H+ antiporter
VKDPHLFNLIFGESILNDAVAIVFGCIVVSKTPNLFVNPA